jgi:hypothetical protein
MRDTDYLVTRSDRDTTWHTTGHTNRQQCHYIYLHFRCKGTFFNTSRRTYVNWVEGNGKGIQRSWLDEVMSSVKHWYIVRAGANFLPFPHRRLCPPAVEDEDEKGQVILVPQDAWRQEVNPHEYLHLIANFSRPGAVVLDSTAGSFGALAVASIRLGRVCIAIESDQGGIFEAAQLRVDLIYRYFKLAGLLCAVGASPEPPEGWEMQGQTWQSRMKAGFVVCRQGMSKFTLACVHAGQPENRGESGEERTGGRSPWYPEEVPGEGEGALRRTAQGNLGEQEAEVQGQACEHGQGTVTADAPCRQSHPEGQVQFMRS